MKTNIMLLLSVWYIFMGLFTIVLAKYKIDEIKARETSFAKCIFKSCIAVICLSCIFFFPYYWLLGMIGIQNNKLELVALISITHSFVCALPAMRAYEEADYN